jgi:hypothetical protein
VQIDPQPPSPAEQFYDLREEMLGNRLKELLGPETQPEDVSGRLGARQFEDGEFQVLLDGIPILQCHGPLICNGFACIWKTANFRTA